MKDIFASYHMLFATNGLKWSINEIQKVAVRHRIYAIRSQVIYDRLTHDISFSKYVLCKSFNACFAHATQLSEAYRIIDAVRMKRSDTGDGRGGSGRSGCGEGSRADGRGNGRGAEGFGSIAQGGRKAGSSVEGSITDERNDKLPIYLWDPYKGK